MTAGAAFGVCAPWVAADDLGCGEAETRDVAVQLASDVLYVLSGQHWPGVQERVVRPRVVCSEGCWETWMVPSDPLVGWPVATVLPPGRCAGRHDLAGPSRLRLPGPVAAITSVVIDNVTLDPGDYALQGLRTLVRLDGEQWPMANDLTRAANTANPGDADPAWQITYDWGAEPPPSGVAVCAELACEIVAAIEGAEGCRLLWGAQVQTVARRGVNITYKSIADALKDGMTGLDTVDLWLNAARGGPYRPRKARIVRADAPRRRPIWTV